MSAETVCLGDVAHIQQGQWLPLDQQLGGPCPVFGANGVTGGTDAGHYTHEVVALGCRGTCGSLHVAPTNSWIGNNAMALWPKDSSTLSLAFLLEAIRYTGTASVTKKNAQPMISRADLRTLTVPLPAFAEQARIVDLLGAADRMVDATGAEVEAAEYARAQLVDGFLAAVRHRAPIGPVLKVRTGTVTVADDVLYTQVTVSGKGRGMRLREQKHGKDIGTKKQRVISTDDLIVSKLGASDGACCVVPAEFAGAIVTQDFPTFAVRMDAALPGYLDIVVRTSQFAHQCASITTGTGQGRVNMGRFGDLPIPLPDLAEQKALVEIAAVATARIESAKARFEAARHLRDQLLHDLLSGSHTIPDSYDRMLDKEGA